MVLTRAESLSPPDDRKRDVALELLAPFLGLADALQARAETRAVRDEITR